jgi:hypothetical protein
VPPFEHFAVQFAHRPLVPHAAAVSALPHVPAVAEVQQPSLHVSTAEQANPHLPSPWLHAS